MFWNNVFQNIKFRNLGSRFRTRRSLGNRKNRLKSIYYIWFFKKVYFCCIIYLPLALCIQEESDFTLNDIWVVIFCTIKIITYNKNSVLVKNKLMINEVFKNEMIISTNQTCLNHFCKKFENNSIKIAEIFSFSIYSEMRKITFLLLQCHQ